MTNPDLQTLLNHCKWLVHRKSVIEPAEIPFLLSAEFRDTYPTLSRLLDRARVSHWKIDGQAHRLFAWTDYKGEAFGWLNVLEPESAWKPGLIAPHRLLLREVGGIREQFFSFNHSSDPFFSSMAGSFTGSACPPACDYWGGSYDEYCYVNDRAPVDIRAWIAFSYAGNGDFIAYNPADERVYIFAHDYGFGFEGITPLEGQPECTLYTIDGVTSFVDYVENLAEAWYGQISSRVFSPLQHVPPLPAAPNYQGVAGPLVIKRALCLGLVDEEWAQKLLETDEILHLEEADLKWLIGFGPLLISTTHRFATKYRNDPEALDYLRQSLRQLRVSPAFSRMVANSSDLAEADAQKTRTLDNNRLPALCFKNELELEDESRFGEILSHATFLSLHCKTLKINAQSAVRRFTGEGLAAIYLFDRRQQVVWVFSMEFDDLMSGQTVTRFALAADQTEPPPPVEISFAPRNDAEEHISSFAIYKTVFTDLAADPKKYAHWLPPETEQNLDSLRVHYSFIRHIVLTTSNGNSLIISQSDKMGAYEVFLNDPERIAGIEQAAADALSPLERVFCAGPNFVS